MALRAWAALLSAADKFPKEPAILYNLACYSCLMGRIADGWAWFEMAFKVVEDQKQLKLKALDDVDNRMCRANGAIIMDTPSDVTTSRTTAGDALPQLR